MTTLTTTVEIWKKAGRFLGILAALAVALFILVWLGQFLIKRVVPPTPPPPMVAFGKIPALDLSEGIKPLDDSKFLVETISGDLPNLGYLAKVFAIGKPSPTFGELEESITKATRAGFSPSPVETSANFAKFVDLKNSNRKLTIAIIGESIELESNFLNDPKIINLKLKSQEGAKSAVMRFFDRLNLPIDRIPEEKISLENFKVENGVLKEAVSISDANLVKVVFTSADLDDLAIINPNSYNPLVWGLATDKEVVAAKYITSDIQKHRFSTYPLKNVQTAFEDLKNGKGRLNKKQTTNVFVVRDVILGYLATATYQPYLQPVYIFKSDDLLTAYVSAVDNAWIR